MTNFQHTKHWELSISIEKDKFEKFSKHGTPFQIKEKLPSNTALFVYNEQGGKRLEGIYDSEINAVRRIQSDASNRDLRLYEDAIDNDNITIIAVDGLMGTGKTSTVVEKIINKYLIKDFKNNKLDKPAEHKILIAKPHINAGGSHEQYGFLSGDINEKLDPTLGNFIQYFDRWHPAGFNKLRESGVVQILPLGFIRGLDAENMTIIVDEAQNTKELVSVVTRKAKKNSKIILIGDTSPFQIDLEQNTTEKNGLKHIIELLSGANYFQYIEMKSIEHIVRSDEVKDIVKRLFKKYGTEGKWIV